MRVVSTPTVMHCSMGTEIGPSLHGKYVKSFLPQYKVISHSLFTNGIHGLDSTRSILGRRKGIQCSANYGDLSAVTLLMSSRKRSRRPLQAISGDLDGGVSKDNLTSDEQTLEQELQNAIAEENYSLAAKLRDALRVLHEDNRAAILAANSRFYDAFCKGDLAAMSTIWSKGDHVQCVHPGAGRICGYDLVMESWELVSNADIEFPLKIELQNTEVYVRGDLGYVTSLEVVKTKGSSWGRQVATNVFEKVRGQWLLCIHHASHIGV
ncbi:uncharacterized protein LOC116250789 isoform X2 [Nymphaea colorata]|uniref:uncharacterized protein LOC116250789 isoform X2 n=1 Tax=Nymphaea colorata TaxID=210225 RepID=UPI00129EA9DA|nr:uncharacterized protein LOC116250789 isoform X2 [Nymphaea colorata]